MTACECRRPDERDNPHRHDRSALCDLWATWSATAIEDNRRETTEAGEEAVRTLGEYVARHPALAECWYEECTLDYGHEGDHKHDLEVRQARIQQARPGPGVMTPVPNKPKTPVSNFRIPPDLKTAAQAKATERGETLTDVVIRALERYVKR